MNKEDNNVLTEYWRRETSYVNDTVDDAFKDAQDHAYAFGLKRGKEEVTDLAKRLVAARDAEDQREWVAILDALYKIGGGDTAQEKFKAANVTSNKTLCIDTKGRICAWGTHFMNAAKDGAYPVRVYLLRDDMAETPNVK